MTKYAIRDIRWNRFRNRGRYPVNETRVKTLIDSFEATHGVWDGVIIASEGEEPGTAELVFGHTRLVAAERKYGPDYEIDLTVRAVTDDQRIKMMAHENSADFGMASAAVDQETIRAVVEAAAKGLIALPEPDHVSINNLRYAPSFALNGKRQSHEDRRFPYTAQTVAQYIGWTKNEKGEAQEKVKWAIGACELMEEGVLTQADFDGLTTNEAQAVLTEARKAKDRREREAKAADRRARASEAQGRQGEAAKHKADAQQKRDEGHAKAAEVGRHVAKALKDGEGYKHAAEVAAEVDTPEKTTKLPPDFPLFLDRLLGKIEKVLWPEFDDTCAKLDLMVELKADIANPHRERAAKCLREAAKRFQTYADALAPDAQTEPLDGKAA